MSAEPSIFTVVQRDDRTTVAFRDWPSVRERFFTPDLPDFLLRVRAELDEAIAANQSAVLTINMAPVDFAPSSFLGVLVGLHRSGAAVELLHVSAGVRRAMESTRLDQVLVVRE
jgi:hypothetical protein